MATGMLALGRGLKKTEEKEESPKNDLHRQSSKTIDALLLEVSLKHGGPKQKNAHWLLDSKPFQGLVYSVITLNSVQMGLAVDFWEEGDVWNAFEHLFTALFLIEMGLKLYFLRKDYFLDGWNRLDCFLVCMSILDNWMIKPAIGDGSALSQLSVLRIMRVLRVARLARLLKVFKELWIILKGILESLKVMFWVTMLLLLTLYVCSILCVDILGRKNGGFDGYDDEAESIESSLQIAGWNNFQYFGTMSRSMYTLFNIVILSEFTEIGRPTYERQPMMIFFFLFFIVFTTFGVLNVIIGVIVDNTMEAAKAMEQDLATREMNEKLALLLRIRDMVFALDADQSGSISMDEVEEGWNLSELQDLLADVDLPKGWTASELMCLLDADGDGELTFDEFMRSFYRLIMSNPFQMNCCMHASLNEVKQNVLHCQKGLMELKTKQAEDMEYIKDLLKKIIDILSGKRRAKDPQDGNEDGLLNGHQAKTQQQSSELAMTLPGMPLELASSEDNQGAQQVTETALQSRTEQHLPPINHSMDSAVVQSYLNHSHSAVGDEAFCNLLAEMASEEEQKHNQNAFNEGECVTILAEMSSMRNDLGGQIGGLSAEIGGLREKIAELQSQLRSKRNQAEAEALNAATWSSEPSSVLASAANASIDTSLDKGDVNRSQRVTWQQPDRSRDSNSLDNRKRMSQTDGGESKPKQSWSIV